MLLYVAYADNFYSITQLVDTFRVMGENLILTW